MRSMQIVWLALGMAVGYVRNPVFLKNRVSARLFALGMAVGLLCVAEVTEAQKPKPDPSLDAKEAGPDFAVQGEYEGQAGEKDKLGVQVVALGDGKFDVLFLTGGLPGAGWDGKTKAKASANTMGRKTDTLTLVDADLLAYRKWTCEIADGKLTGVTGDGKRL